MALQDQSELRTWLSDVDYPARRDALVARAQQNGAPEYVVAALQAMPPVEYQNRNEIESSIEISEGQTDREKAKERRHHTHPDLAETETEVPQNPIAEELGYNRKR